MKTSTIKRSSAEEVLAASNELKRVHSTMTFLRPLTALERRRGKRLGPQAIDQAQRCLAAAREHKDTMPQSLDLEAFASDVENSVALGKCLAAASQICSDLQDSIRVCGGRASDTAATVLGHIKAASRNISGLTQTVGELARFRRRANRGAESTPPAAVIAEEGTKPVKSGEV